MLNPPRVFIAALPFLLTSCASFLDTLSSGTSYTVERPPFYKGTLREKVANVGLFPVATDRCMGGAFFSAPLLEKVKPAVARELSELRLFPLLPPVDESPSQAPGLYLGVDKSAPGRRNAMTVTRPSKRWARGMAQRIREGQVDYALFVSVSITDHWVRERGWLGKKEVPLGTGAVVKVPWLTDVETPVQVLQVNGILFDAEGAVVRSGSEGLILHRTPMHLIDIPGGQELMDAGDVASLEGARRDDLPGSPLKLTAAVRNLVGQLLGRDHLLMEPTR